MVGLRTGSGTLSGGFDIWYEVPLSSTVPIYIRGDRRTIRDNQDSLVINELRITENYGRFITIRNNAGSAISFWTGGIAIPLIEQRGTPSLQNFLTATNRREFSPGETAVYDISRDAGNISYFIDDSGRRVPFFVPQPLKRNHLYSFSYNGSAVILTDSRPLHRAGEPAWAKTISNATDPMMLVSAEEQIHLFTSIDQNIAHYTFGSAGNEKSQNINPGYFHIRAASQTADGFLIAGFEQTGRDLRPIARIHGEDGVLRRSIEPSTRRDIHSAYFSTVAQKDNSSWLLTGGGMQVSDQAFFPYARHVRDDGGRLATLWELTRADFETHTPGIICGAVSSAIYDPVRNRWLLTGQTLRTSASYLAEVNAEGIIQKIDTSFIDLSFNKILLDTDGYYLAGYELKDGGRFAFIAKYNTGGGQIWRLSEQPRSNSYYQDVILDIENNRIILAGTMQATEASGRNGVPFIDAVNMETGELLWREILSDPSLSGTSLVTAIAHAPDYGFVLTLSGYSDWFEKPYMITRVNSQGKLLKE